MKHLTQIINNYQTITLVQVVGLIGQKSSPTDIWLAEY